MNEKQKLEECIAYFKARPIFDRVLSSFWMKYRSIGRFGGEVVLTHLTDEERDDLEGFLQKNCHGIKTVHIPAKRFVDALSNSRFDGIDPKDLLCAYFDKPLITKEEERAQEENAWRKQILQVASTTKNGSAHRWLEELLEAVEKHDGTNKSLSYLKRRKSNVAGDSSELTRLLHLGVQILERLPLAEPTYLAVYATELTGNPHAFDIGEKDASFLALLTRWLNTDQESRHQPAAIERQRQYLEVGLLLNDTTNFLMALGIRAIKSNGEEHMGMKGFYEEKETVQIPLAVLSKWEWIHCPNNRLYIVENASVYAVLCKVWIEKQALVCSYGQPRLSMFTLLDLLEKSGAEVWYAGDLDPEGLLMAQTLSQYYTGSFHYWRMDVEAYENSLSDVRLSEERLKKLEQVSDNELKETALAIAQVGKAGYQEKLIERYINDIVE